MQFGRRGESCDARFVDEAVWAERINFVCESTASWD